MEDSLWIEKLCMNNYKLMVKLSKVPIIWIIIVLELPFLELDQPMPSALNLEVFSQELIGSGETSKLLCSASVNLNTMKSLKISKKNAMLDYILVDLLLKQLQKTLKTFFSIMVKLSQFML